MSGEYLPVFAYSKSGDEVLKEKRVDSIAEIDGKLGYYDSIICVDSLVSPDAYTIIDD